MWVTKEPWNLPAATNEILTEWLQLRHRLIPYLHTMNVRAAEEGEPLVQPLYWEWPNTEAAYKYLNQYLFGSHMLVIPITSPQQHGAQLGRVQGWLPSGTWVDYFTKTVYHGDRELSFSRPIGKYPVFMPEGAIVPLDRENTPGNGAARPQGIEVVVVVGSNGKFVLLEDPEHKGEETERAEDGKHSDGMDRTPLMYTQSTGVLQIGPVESASASQATSGRRSWTVRFIALDVQLSSIQAQLNDQSLTVDAQNEPGSISVSIGEFSNSSSATISLGPDPRLRKNDPLAMLEPVIKNGQVPYKDKDELWNAAIKEESMALKVNSIQSLEVDEGLKQFALECLLADQE